MSRTGQADDQVPWHVRSADEVLRELGSDAERGLSEHEAAERLERFGENRIRGARVEPLWQVLLRQFADPLILILLVAAVVSLAFGEHVDASIILVVVVLNATIGITQEGRARRAIGALARMTAALAVVVRDGAQQDIDSDRVVPGDIVVLAAGGRVPADLRLVTANNLALDESALTGESQPVAKHERPIGDAGAVPGDRHCMAFAGTDVTRGRGRGVVVRTGERSELGRIAEATHAVTAVATPMVAKMQQLGRRIGAAVVVLALLVVAVGLVTGTEVRDVTRTAVALAVGAVPEALPIVLTVTLAVGVQRMARRNAIVRALPAVETLGSTTVVASDKTGTLTTNRMAVAVVWAAGERHRLGHEEPPVEVDGPARRTLLGGLLANEAYCSPERGADRRRGDPTELALVVAAGRAGLECEEARQGHPRLDLIPFESDARYMATLNDTPQGRRVFMKGSPEVVLERCSRELDGDGSERPLDADRVREAAEALAEEGYRVLATAERASDDRRFDGADPGSELVFTGLLGLEDPVRPEANEAVASARRAGVRVVMVTGDHARTAKAIARQLGIGGDDPPAVEGRALETMSDGEADVMVREVDVYARVAPHHKLELVERLKAAGHVVAVTGDGVNDAPALRAAHIGVAMGRGGTDVAREASEMVLADDNFATIRHAIEEGRVVFANVRKVTYFLLSTGAALALTVLSSLFGAWPLPYVAAQVLWINLVTNGLQDVALAFERGEPGLLDEPPRDPDAAVLDRALLSRLVWVACFIALATVLVFWWTLQQGAELELARSVAMTQMVVFQFFQVLNARSFERSVLRVPLAANRFLFASVTAAALAHVGALHLPFMQAVLGTRPLAAQQWLLVLVVGATLVLAVESEKAILRRRRARSSER